MPTLGRRRGRAGALGAATAAGACGLAAAQPQYSTGFEAPTYLASAQGISMNGQGGWYTPIPFPVDGRAYTYAGNVPGFSPPPGGGAQFVVLIPAANASRIERAVDFSSAGTLVFTHDMALILSGPLSPPVEAPISSFSLGFAGRYFVATNRYVDLGDPLVGWNAAYFVAAPPPGSVINTDTAVTAGPQWRNLLFNHWYRQSTTVDFPANRITSVSITDLATNQRTTANPPDWYLNGGSDPTAFPLPTVARFSANNYAQHNMAWDNFQYGPPAAACYANCDGSTTSPLLNVNDFVCFQSRFAAGEPYADCDQSGGLNVNDFVCFQTRFAAGCSGP